MNTNVQSELKYYIAVCYLKKLLEATLISKDEYAVAGKQIAEQYGVLSWAV